MFLFCEQQVLLNMKYPVINHKWVFLNLYCSATIELTMLGNRSSCRKFFDVFCIPNFTLPLTLFMPFMSFFPLVAKSRYPLSHKWKFSFLQRAGDLDYESFASPQFYCSLWDKKIAWAFWRLIIRFKLIGGMTEINIGKKYAWRWRGHVENAIEQFLSALRW